LDADGALQAVPAKAVAQSVLTDWKQHAQSARNNQPDAENIPIAGIVSKREAAANGVLKKAHAQRQQTAVCAQWG